MPQKNKKRTWKVAKPEKDKLNLPIALKLKQALIDFGYKGLQLEFLLDQGAHESAGFYKQKAIDDNNFGGIKWTKRMKTVKASNKFHAPGSENHGKRDPYVHFNSIEEFASKWAALAYLNDTVHGNKIGPPLGATIISEYDRRLTLNHYHQASDIAYTADLKKWDPIIKKELLQNPASTLLPGIPANNDLDFSDYIKRHVMVSDKARLAKPYIQNHSFAPSKKKENGLINNVNKLFDFDTIQNMHGLIAGNTAKKEKAGSAKPNGLPQMITAIQLPLAHKANANNTRSRQTHNGSTRSINYPNNNRHDVPLNDPLNIVPASGSGIFSNSKTNKNPGPMLVPANTQKNGFDRQYGTGNNNSSTASVHINTPLIGQLTIHAGNVNDGISKLKNKIEEVLLEVLNSSRIIS